MASDFPVVDCFGHTVYLSDANWERHVAQRAEIGPYRGDLPLVLTAPAFVIEGASDGSYHFYRRDFPTKPLTDLWLHVIVRYDSDADGWVVTVWLTRRLAPGVQRWPKS